MVESAELFVGLGLMLMTAISGWSIRGVVALVLQIYRIEARRCKFAELFR